MSYENVKSNATRLLTVYVGEMNDIKARGLDENMLGVVLEKLDGLSRFPESVIDEWSGFQEFLETKDKTKFMSECPLLSNVWYGDTFDKTKDKAMKKLAKELDKAFDDFDFDELTKETQ